MAPTSTSLKSSLVVNPMSSEVASLANAQAKALYEQWRQTIELIESTTDSRVIRMWTEDLHELHAHAQSLLTFDVVHHVNQNYLKIITARPVEEWVILAKDKNAAFISY